jgi:hypothetical protein
MVNVLDRVDFLTSKALSFVYSIVHTKYSGIVGNVVCQGQYISLVISLLPTSILIAAMIMTDRYLVHFMILSLNYSYLHLMNDI